MLGISAAVIAPAAPPKPLSLTLNLVNPVPAVTPLTAIVRIPAESTVKGADVLGTLIAPIAVVLATGNALDGTVALTEVTCPKAFTEIPRVV